MPSRATRKKFGYVTLLHVNINCKVLFMSTVTLAAPNRSRRLPLEPLMRELDALGTSELALILGVSRWTVLRMKKNGLTIDQADGLAVRFAGTHPLCIWGWEFYADLSPTDDTTMEVAA